jgi:hypothetical protein
LRLIKFEKKIGQLKAALSNDYDLV